MITTAVILAAGRGTRLGEVTRTHSKAMVPIAGEPMIARVMHRIAQAGVRRFVVVAAPSDAELKGYCAGRHDVTIVEQRQPLGSGDALHACRGIVSGSFIVSACDSVVSAEDIARLCLRHEHEAAYATIGVLTVSADTPLEARSVVRIDSGRIVQMIEKPKPGERISNITALPLYACRAEIFSELLSLPPSVRGEYELPAVFSRLAERGERLLASEVTQRLDLTTPSDLLALNRVFLEQQQPALQVDVSASVATGVTLVAPVLVGPGCVVGDGVMLGPCVYLESQVTVSAGSTVAHVVALSGAQVSGEVSRAVICKPSESQKP